MLLEASKVFEISSSKKIQGYIKDNLFDPWESTCFAGYRFMDNKQKGALGEMIVRSFFEESGAEVKSPISSTAGHDLIIDDILTEVKFSLAHTNLKKRTTKEDCFTMNHVALGKDWERLIFLGINYDMSKTRFKFMTKELFSEALHTGDYFSYQQGGNKAKNDDYIIASAKLKKLINSRFMKDISEW